MNNVRYTAFRYLTAIVLAIAGVLSIIASGGGGGSSFSPTSAQGLWTGTTDTGREIFGVVLDDGSYWFIYTRVVVGPPPLILTDSFIQGTGSTSGSDFSSSNARNFNGAGFFNSGGLDASFSARTTLDGTFIYPDFSEVLNTTYDAAYDLTPSLADIAGTYAGSSINIPFGGSRSANVVISAAGTITVSGAQTCNNFDGTIMTHAAGNVYDVSGTILNVDCNPGASREVNGIAFFDAATQTLYLTAVDSGRAHGYFFTGIRQ